MLTRDCVLSLFTLWISGCTFPSVDYVDASLACNVATDCANQAVKCGSDARRRSTTCENSCSPNKPDCKANCRSTRASEITQCTTQCTSCGQSEGCLNGTANCEALVGN